MLDVSSNVSSVLSYTDRLSKQYRFAVALALTDTVRAIKDAMPAALEQALDNPTPFTKAGFYITPARKDAPTLTASVAAKDRQASYLQWQIEGGSRPPNRQALRLPGEVQLNVYGNMPAGLVRQLVVRAKAGKRATKTQAARFGVSQKTDLFYGEPGDGRPAGIYKRIEVSATRHQLVPLVVFPKQNARYQKRFDFKGKAQAVAKATFEPALRKAWARAQATAR